jgi:hypothetical protein
LHPPCSSLYHSNSQFSQEDSLDELPVMYNPWKENLKDTPKESLNWRLWYGVFGKTFPYTGTVFLN